METIYSVVPSQWGHEVSQGRRIIPPTPEDLVPMHDEFGAPIVDDEGNEVLVPSPAWEQRIENVDLDGIVLIDPQSSAVFKFLFTKEALGNFLSYFTPNLDADGRQLVRQALDESSSVVVPDVDVSNVVSILRKG